MQPLEVHLPAIPLLLPPYSCEACFSRDELKVRKGRLCTYASIHIRSHNTVYTQMLCERKLYRRSRTHKPSQHVNITHTRAISSNTYVLYAVIQKHSNTNTFSYTQKRSPVKTVTYKWNTNKMFVYTLRKCSEASGFDF